jgi:hypothetical protein
MITGRVVIRHLHTLAVTRRLKHIGTNVVWLSSEFGKILLGLMLLTIFWSLLVFAPLTWRFENRRKCATGT